MSAVEYSVDLSTPEGEAELAKRVGDDLAADAGALLAALLKQTRGLAPGRPIAATADDFVKWAGWVPKDDAERALLRRRGRALATVCATVTVGGAPVLNISDDATEFRKPKKSKARR